MQETKEIIKQVRKIEISTKHLVDGLISGNYHSIFKGNGIEFSEIREYEPGDDIRAIDWKVTARFNHPYIKEFIEERDLSVYFIFDVSASGMFGNNVAKKRKAIELCASLMFSALKNNDKVGLFLFSNNIEKFIPSRKGRKHVLKAISTLVSFEPKESNTNIKDSLKSAAKIIKRRSVVFIVSDFIDKGNFSKELRILKRRHDVIGIKISDLHEKEIPNVGLVELEDEETGEQILLDTSNEEFRKKYKELIQGKESELKNLFNKEKMDLVEIMTNEAYEKPLKKFFKTRKKRAR
jgi:uncharacterized protein (DUF58 family)